jgi:hypothetical protein
MMTGQSELVLVASFHLRGGVAAPLLFLLSDNENKKPPLLIKREGVRIALFYGHLLIFGIVLLPLKLAPCKKMLVAEASMGQSLRLS